MSDFTQAMAVVFGFPAADIEAAWKDATTVTLTFSIRDPSQTSTLIATIKSGDAITTKMTAELKKKGGVLASLQIASLSEPKTAAVPKKG